jgi:predicted CoA-binding protein
MLDSPVVERLIDEMRTVAVVGLSDKVTRPSFGVARYLRDRGVRIVPVNPRLAGSTVLGELVYGSLLDIPRNIEVDIVDIFRRSELVPPVVLDAIARGDAKAIWMQQGVVNEEAAARARAAGMTVVMDACLAVQHRLRSR